MLKNLNNFIDFNFGGDNEDFGISFEINEFQEEQ